MPGRYDLDVDAPEKVAAVLDYAAQKYRESASELDSSWQDPGAGKPWDDIAKILNRAATSIRKRRRTWRF